MLTDSQRIDSLDEMREYVNENLCYHEKLEVDAFPMTERFLVRSGELCGIYFCLHGPRAVKFSAIWDTDRNIVLFYGSTGERFLKTQLAQQPCLPSLP
jgi:hypothetical protein